MSSDSDDLPEELLWKGDLDDEGHDDLELYGGDLDGTLVGRPAHGAVGVLDTSDEEDDEDPLGGIDILGSINLSPDLKSTEPFTGSTTGLGTPPCTAACVVA